MVGRDGSFAKPCWDDWIATCQICRGNPSSPQYKISSKESKAI